MVALVGMLVCDRYMYEMSVVSVFVCVCGSGLTVKLENQYGDTAWVEIKRESMSGEQNLVNNGKEVYVGGGNTREVTWATEDLDWVRWKITTMYKWHLGWYYARTPTGSQAMHVAATNEDKVVCLRFKSDYTVGYMDC